MSRSLVFWLRRVNLIYPVKNSALQVERFLESDRSQELYRLGASTAHLAVDDHFRIRVELGIPPRYVAERHQRRSRDPVDLIFVRLADIEDRDIVSAVD